MSGIVNGGDLGLILCQMFDINPTNVLAIEVSARVGEPASVTVTTRPIFVADPVIVRTYQLVRNEE